MNSRCYKGYRPLLTGDTDGLCQVCRNQKQRNEEMEKHEKQLDIHRSEYIAKLETELEELKRDVKRYFYLDEKLHVDRLTVLEAQEKCELAVKLSKVCEEE